MAGISWIKIETTLPNKPVVLRLRRLLKKNQSEVVGLLVRLLCWADGVTEDGSIADAEPEDIDFIVNCDGFGRALIEAGWLVEADGGLKFNSWNTHNGATAKKRAVDARRSERYRDKQQTASRNTVTDVTQHRDECVTKSGKHRDLDKIRIDNNIDNTDVLSMATPPSKKRNEVVYAGATYIIPEDGHNIEFLDAFGKQPKDPRAFMINWKAALDEVKDGALLVEAAKIAIQRMIEREGDTTFLQAPEYWLGDRKYRDYLSQSKRAVQVSAVNKFKVNYEG